MVTLCTVIPGTLIALRGYTKIAIIRKSDVADCAILIGFESFSDVLKLIMGLVCIPGRFSGGSGYNSYEYAVQVQFSVHREADHLAQFNAYAGIMHGPATFFCKVSVIL
ncbi:hypothetical protein BDV96DRAFT_596960 [Lophiotrema nucula]|uniref:Uncharacterized protein n=1 Tax=Lophiotrema nucula TaxID=690887 RepID=A0A6A5ZGP0_9PLEO|nr:hypothetical protein BDV96DRAFT_596960 [Lophiotrema nucula]